MFGHVILDEYVFPLPYKIIWWNKFMAFLGLWTFKFQVFSKLLIQMSSRKLNPKHAGFVHTLLSDYEVTSLLYTIVYLLSLYLECS